ncbi:hypothetical protein [Algibacter pacificus]|uniref:hypothetical protein n=1 Tax=Algibacter pacificus TaxID=2599389 RepID=UPI0011CCCCA5|nr:hypothetical protein [Algibacter pacificus]
MFSTEQKIFGAVFFIVFAIIIGFMYRKDLKLHKQFYKGSIWVLFAFIAFILSIAAIKFFFK